MRHIKDSEFVRGEVPITKEEIRWVSIGKLQIEESDICLDIGGGTGSISIEMANFASKGKVYVIETNEEAISLINQNIEKFKKNNIELIKGLAPVDLPNRKFNKIFVGGTKGEIEKILDYVEENLAENGKIVLNFIVLENLLNGLNGLKTRKFKNIEVTQMQTSKNRLVGKMNMMIGGNPIFIISAERG